MFVGIVALVIVVAFTKGLMKSILHNAPTRSQPTGNVFDDTQSGNTSEQLDARMTNAFFECLLAEEPGAINDAAAQAIALNCRQRYPDARGLAEAKPSHFFGYDTPAACVAANAKSTPSNEAAKMIWTACRALY